MVRLSISNNNHPDRLLSMHPNHSLYKPTSFALNTANSSLLCNIGEPGSHDLAKEMIVGFAGAEVDRLAETKGEDAWDREKAKRQAEQNSRDLYDQQCESIFGPSSRKWIGC